MQETGKIHGDVIAVKMVMQSGGGLSGTLKMERDALEEIKKLPPLGKHFRSPKGMIGMPTDESPENGQAKTQAKPQEATAAEPTKA